MQKLSTCHLQAGGCRRAHGVICALGMTAVLLSLFKRLLYPVLYTYYRTGSEGALDGQALYAIALLATIVVLLVFHRELSDLAGKHRWAIAAIGLCGSIATAMTALSDYSSDAMTAIGHAGGVMAAIYIPVHFVFWAANAQRDGTMAMRRIVGSSALLVAIIFTTLTATGLNTACASIAFPLASTALALALPRESGRAEAGDGSDSAGGGSACAGDAHDGAPKADAERDSVQQAENAAVPEAAVPEAADILPEGFARNYDLSDREAEIAAYAYRNLSAKRIAATLFIAESTVYTHLKRIYRKTDVHSKQELIDLIDSQE